ncbi:TrmH family RNA methyltransferase [Mycoplasmopsis iners]|uniref:TrmH family RNA methyltransferase n=1 Tax=Mycoplasmopsis iners TaxID=76630 RepID=UPI0004966655|nr:RNA methyltransferase [Mycoplasmopsis iners]
MRNNLISSVQNDKVKKLKAIKRDNKSEFFLVENYHLVEEALKQNLVIEIYELDSKNTYSQATKITDNVLKSLTTLQNPEGVIALCHKPQKVEIGNKIVFLDNVQDPGNVGTIIRNMRAFGFDTLFTNVNVYNDKIIRSTQGALFDLNIIKIQDSYAPLKELKQKGYCLLATSLDKDSINFSQYNYKKDKLVIILGNEGQGINKQLYELCDAKIYIPIDFESLNVAVASGIILNKIYNG